MPRRKTLRRAPSRFRVVFAITLVVISISMAGFWVVAAYNESSKISTLAKITSPDSTPPGTYVLPTVNPEPPIALIAPPSAPLDQWTNCVGPWSQAQLDTFCNCWGYGRAQKCWYTYFEIGDARVTANPSTNPGDPDRCVDTNSVVYNYNGGVGAWGVACTQCNVPSTMGLDLTLPDTVPQSASVTASVSNMIDCDGMTVYIRKDNCNGDLKCSFVLAPSVTGCNFNAPATVGTYTYAACLDVNGDGSFVGSEGESATADLDVIHTIACNDGLVEGAEKCDGTNFTLNSGVTKACNNIGLGFTGGTLGCKSDCTDFVTTQCYTCGNGAREGSEVCDSEDLGGKSCVILGHDGGDLHCRADCTGYDVSQCSDCPNGKVEADEKCDWTGGLANFTNMTGFTRQCNNIGQGFIGGTLGCMIICQMNTTLCTNPPNCGNGKVDTSEECEGTNYTSMANATVKNCTNIGRGFTGGTLGCTAGCVLDTSTCISPLYCGNGKVDGDEECDKTNLTGQTCMDAGFAGGALRCKPDCTLNTSLCINSPTTQCGNGIVETGEQCDGSILAGNTCINNGFTGGTMSCKSDCTLNTAGCTAQTGVTAAEAQAALNDAKAAILDASTAGKNVTAATQMINDAWSSFYDGDFGTAKLKADMAKVSAENAEAAASQGFELGDTAIYIIIAIVIAAGAAGGAFWYFKIRKPSSKRIPEAPPAAPPAPE